MSEIRSVIIMTSSVLGLLKLDRASVEGLRVKALRTNSMLSDDEPLYDSVASDEDYASIGDNHSAKGIKMDDKPPDVGHIFIFGGSLMAGSHYTSPSSLLHVAMGRPLSSYISQTL